MSERRRNKSEERERERPLRRINIPFSKRFFNLGYHFFFQKKKKKGKEEEVQFFFVERISPTEKNAFCDLGHHTRSIFTNHRNNRDENPKPLDKDRDTINTAS